MRWWEEFFLSESAKQPHAYHYQTWDHINLEEFHSDTLWHHASYAYLWLVNIISVIAYVADTYTAIVLVAFNRWPGQVTPAVSFAITRWIFFICILISFFLLAFKWIRCYMVIQNNSVVKDYLDPHAAMVQSFKSWRRFLVFASLTESRRGTDYTALFTYFSFKGFAETLIANGPRQSINAMTLWAFVQQYLLANGGDHDISKFFANLRDITAGRLEYSAIIFTMFFTLFIWIFSMASLIAGVICYVAYLYPNIGPRLTHYCKRRLEKRLHKIVEEAIRANGHSGTAKSMRDLDRDTRNRQDSDSDLEKKAMEQHPTDSQLEPGPIFNPWRSFSSDSGSSRSSYSTDSWFLRSSCASNDFDDGHRQLLKTYVQQPQRSYDPRDPYGHHKLAPHGLDKKPAHGGQMDHHRGHEGKLPVHVVPGPMYGGWGDNQLFGLGEKREDPTKPKTVWMDAKAMEEWGVK